MLALFLLPIFMIAVFTALLPPVYDGTFVGELSEKYDRLQETDAPKIVIVAGSSAAFGIDSEMISEELGYEVVNFGLYANLGTKLMMDLSKANINEGDIIILAPELNSQTLSLYFNSETAAQSLDGSFYMLKNVDSADYESLIGATWKFVSRKLGYLLSATSPENAGAYRKENFNEYGDNVFDRPYNVLSGSMNQIVLDFRTDYTDGVTTEYEEYIDYVNDYVRYAEKRGASVYFSFPPMDAAAIQIRSDSDITDFYENLVRSLDCKVISNIYDYILDDGYFYDSEFHLNNSGVVIRTVKLIDDIKRELGIDSVTVPVTSLPAPSGKRPDCDDFELRRLENARAWAVYSLTDTGAEKSYVTIPDEVNGIPVTTISTGAFAGSDVSMITLGRNIRSVEWGSVKNASNLAGVIIPEGIDPEKLELPDDIGSGCLNGFRIFVQPSEYDSYLKSENFASLRDLIAPDESFVFETSDGRAVITGLTESGKMRTELTVPDTYNGLPVTEIASYAFGNVYTLEKLTLGANIKKLDDNAFSATNSGLEVYIPAGISPDRLEMPDSPVILGGDIKIFVDWVDYGTYLVSDALRGYADIITTDNPYLMLERADDGSWTVVGVNEFGADLSELTVPDYVSGAAVRTIAENAFDGTSLKTLTLGLSITRLDGGAFRGSRLETVIIPDGIGAGDISVPNNMSEALATDGCRAGLKILVDSSLYSEYISDYFWGDYGSFLQSK